MKQFKVGLVKGRHDIPDVFGYIFDEIEDVTDVESLEKHARNILSRVMFGYKVKTGSSTDCTVHLYVTGLTVALGAVVAACLELRLYLVLYHFNRDTGEYYPQTVIPYMRD